MKKFLVLLFTLALLVCSIFAISVAAEEEGVKLIYSYNISYEGDYRFMVAVPKSMVKEKVTFQVKNVKTGAKSSVTRKVEELGNDLIKDPTLNGMEMWAVRSTMQVAAKDMATNYELVIIADEGTDNQVISKPVTYSLALYLNERLYKNGVILADEGTFDADRRDLYLAMLEQGHNAENVFYNLDNDKSNDVTVFVDELVYSNISGKYQLYTPGTSATAPERILKVSTFACVDGKWEKRAKIENLAGETVVLNEHQVYSSELVESFKDGQTKSLLATPSLNYEKDGAFYYIVTDANGKEQKVYYSLTPNNGYYTEKVKDDSDKTVSLKDANGLIFYDLFEVLDFAEHDNALHIQNLNPVQYEMDENGEYKEDEDGDLIPINYRNNAMISIPVVPTVVNDSIKANDVYVLSLDINVQSVEYDACQIAVRDTSGNNMFVIYFTTEGIRYYVEKAPGEVLVDDEYNVSKAAAGLIFDKQWHSIRLEIGFNYRNTRLYVDDALVLEFVAALTNTYDSGKAVENRREFGKAEFYVANDYESNVYLDNIQFTKKDVDTTTIWTAADKTISLVGGSEVDRAAFTNAYTAKSFDNSNGKIAVVLGDMDDDISRASYIKAKYLLNEGIGILNDEVYQNSTGYVIFAIGSEIAIAYNNDAARDAAFAYFAKNYSTTDLSVADGLLASEFNADAERGAMYEEYLDTLSANLAAANVENADEIVSGIANIYANLYSEEILTWIASLYDPDIGGFYYSNSGKNTLGIQPDLESTMQALAMLERHGIISRTNSNFNVTEERVGKTIYDKMLGFVRGLQAEDGCFYHPQWEGLNISASRIGRDIDNAIYLLNRLNSAPKYDIPGTDMKGDNGAVVPASALTGRLSASKITAVSKVVAVEDDNSSSLPGYLQSIGNWATYLEGLGFGVAGKSYGAGNTISSIHRLVTQADKDYAAAKAAGNAPNISAYVGEDKYIKNADTTTPYVDYLENFVNSKQEANGFFEPGAATWAGLNGLMKISAAYGSYGRTVQKSYEAFMSTLEVVLAASQERSGKESACYVFNAWTCLNSMLRLVRTNASEHFDDARLALLNDAPVLIQMSYDIYRAHAMVNRETGNIYGFSYYEKSPMNTSQGAPVAHSALPEADINSTMLATSSFLGVLFGALNATVDTDLTDGKNVVKTIPLWNCYRDLDIFVDAWQNAEKASNEVQDPSTITFDNYIEDEEHEGNEKYPDSLIYVNVGGANTSSVEQAPGKNNGDLALKVHHEKAASNVQAFISMIDEMRESTKLYYEMDLYVGEFNKNDGLFMQVNFVDGVYTDKMLTGFNLYREDGDTIKIQSSYKHLGNNNKHEEETVKVNYIGNWVNLKFETEKTYTDGVLTGLTTVIYVNGTAYTFSDTFALNTTTDAEGDIVDVNVGRVQLVYYKQGDTKNEETGETIINDVSSTIWIDNVYCGKYKEQTTAN